MKRTVTIASTLLLLAACGGDNNANSTTNNATANNMTANNMTPNNVTPNNMTPNNVTPNNVTPNNVTPNNSNNATIVPCGDITFEGECIDATTVNFCDDDFGLIEIPCADPEFFGANATCIDVPDFGADCALPAGESCEIYDEDSDELFYTFCSGVEPACIWNAADAVVCVDNFGTCDDTFAPSCQGDIYLWECNISQPLAVDCAALGGTCDAATGCIGIPAAGACDDETVFCDAALTCNDEGTCE